MSWLSFIGAIAGLFREIVGWLRERRLIKAGRDEAEKDALAELVGSVEEAQFIRRRLRDDPEFRERMRRRFTDLGP